MFEIKIFGKKLIKFRIAIISAMWNVLFNAAFVVKCKCIFDYTYDQFFLFIYIKHSSCARNNGNHIYVWNIYIILSGWKF